VSLVGITFAGVGGRVVDVLEAGVRGLPLVLPAVDFVFEAGDFAVGLVDAVGEVLDFGHFFLEMCVLGIVGVFV
jgi:hypothetical protein